MYREQSTRRSTPERSGDHTKPTYSGGSDDSSAGDSGSENVSESGEHNTDDVNAGHKRVLEAHCKEDPSSHPPTNAVAAAGVNAAINIPVRGQYMPPSMRRQMMAAAAEASADNDRNQALVDEVKQRESWELLKKRINGPINKVNTSNIKEILIELFPANLIRGRGLFCRSVIKAQSLSRPFTPVYAALVAVINTKLPIVGELLLTRLVLQFRRAFGRDDKDKCLSAIMFIAHLTNQRVAHEVLALQILTLLLENPTDDSVEIAVSFMREIGALLAEIVPRVLNAVFDTFRSILHDADIDKRVQYMIEVLFQYRRDGFKDNPVIPDGLDLVEVEEQIVHEVALDNDDLDGQDELNVFRRDDNFEDNERKYDDIKREILGDGDDSEVSEEDSGGESGSESDTESGSESGAEGIEGKVEGGAVLTKSGLETPATQRIHDLTETEMVNLRRTIYLAIMSSLSFEEAAHKLLKIEIRPGEEQELCNMVIECCSQERTYKTFFGLIGERLCKVNQSLGLKTLSERLKSTEPQMSEAVNGMFPSDSAKSTRFAINYYTSIGLGAITEEMREWLKSRIKPTS
ncbi:pre-mRNA-splicing factor cwc22 [Coemansia sp. RSA 1804]|nr:pre-mRNA-splicing factor cwc22 [Coemansia sp. RSA 1804]